MLRRLSPRLSALLLASGLVAAGAACGSSSTDNNAGAGATTTTAITKAAFVEQANAICTQLNKDAAAIGGKPQTNAEAAEMITKNVDLIDAALAKIKALPQPTEDAAALQATYADSDAATALARQMVTALSSGGQAEAQALGTQLDAAQAKANASMRAYGLSECGKGS